MSEDGSEQDRLRELKAELELTRRDRDAAQLRLLARRLTDAMALRKSEDRVERMRQAFAGARDRLRQMEASTSWRMTGPLRAVMRRIRGEAPPPPLAEPVEMAPSPAAAPTVPEDSPASPQADRPRQQTKPSLDLPEGPFQVAVLLAANGDAVGLARCIASAQLALHRAGSALDVTVAGRDAQTNQADGVRRIQPEGTPSLSHTHNLLLQDGFARGAEVCVVADPSGLFHPDAIRALLGVLAFHNRRALVEALRFPDSHPKGFQPLTLETEWAGGHCLAISRQAFETLGGFDEGLGSSGQDVELSRRARALGWPVLTAPHALFLTGAAAGEPSRPADPAIGPTNPRVSRDLASQPGHEPSGSA